MLIQNVFPDSLGKEQLEWRTLYISIFLFQTDLCFYIFCVKNEKIYFQIDFINSMHFQIQSISISVSWKISAGIYCA